ncbi:unnamed protein product [Paramecium sonneborni]|uniref:Uncharacterized protein n=1 Tax=Paramecium sonneborni TaxID=65129 RepID=A0A8S1NU65_9CILI|nr:unnamed protein product [Paramecium sonneborni]
MLLRDFQYEIRSLQIPSGITLTIFDHPNFEVQKHVFSQSEQCLKNAVFFAQMVFQKQQKFLETQKKEKNSEQEDQQAAKRASCNFRYKSEQFKIQMLKIKTDSKQQFKLGSYTSKSVNNQLISDFELAKLNRNREETVYQFFGSPNIPQNFYKYIFCLEVLLYEFILNFILANLMKQPHFLFNQKLINIQRFDFKIINQSSIPKGKQEILQKQIVKGLIYQLWPNENLISLQSTTMILSFQ